MFYRVDLIKVSRKRKVDEFLFGLTCSLTRRAPKLANLVLKIIFHEINGIASYFISNSNSYYNKKSRNATKPGFQRSCLTDLRHQVPFCQHFVIRTCLVVIKTFRIFKYMYLIFFIIFIQT
jgi:hypothetical protein